MRASGDRRRPSILRVIFHDQDGDHIRAGNEVLRACHRPGGSQATVPGDHDGSSSPGHVASPSGARGGRTRTKRLPGFPGPTELPVGRDSSVRSANGLPPNNPCREPAISRHSAVTRSTLVRPRPRSSRGRRRRPQPYRTSFWPPMMPAQRSVPPRGSWCRAFRGESPRRRRAGPALGSHRTCRTSTCAENGRASLKASSSRFASEPRPFAGTRICLIIGFSSRGNRCHNDETGEAAYAGAPAADLNQVNSIRHGCYGPSPASVLSISLSASSAR